MQINKKNPEQKRYIIFLFTSFISYIFAILKKINIFVPHFTSSNKI
jgi:hypothetical protein